MKEEEEKGRPSAMARLPATSALPRRLLDFLDEHLQTREHLLRGVPSTLAAELGAECDDRLGALLDLEAKLSSLIDAWATRSDEVGKAFHQLSSHLRGLQQYGYAKMGSTRVSRMMNSELPLLAKSVGRIETVRLYAETTFRLEALVGDLEDATFSLMSQNSVNIFSAYLSDAASPSDTKWKQERFFIAIKAMKDIGKVLMTIAEQRPRWTHLLMAVNSRVEESLAVLRPQALTEHRALLASLGWPAPLSTPILEDERHSAIPNPLVLMQGDKRVKYCESFLALCALQHVQAHWEAQKHIFNLLIHQRRYGSPDFTGLSDKLVLELSSGHALWTINELVSPIASRMEHHFSQWSDHPEFMFALVYRITRDFLEGVDNVLQPLIDKARLAGCSAKEAWVSAMIKMLSGYLEKRVFSELAESYDSKGGNSQFVLSWLHLIDLIIAFDKRMRALINSGGLLVGHFSEFDGTSVSHPISMLSLFHDHPHWLEIWTDIELKDVEDKLKAELEDEKNWVIDIKKQSKSLDKNKTDSFNLSSREDYKAPLIADSVIRIAWTMIERGQALPYMSLRIKFIRSSATILLHQFYIILLQRCGEIETTTRTVKDDALLRVASSINAARFCESVMQEWADSVDLVEMSITESNSEGRMKTVSDLQGCFFGDEIKNFSKLETECLVKIMSALLLQFDALCWDYLQSRDQWGQDLDVVEVDGDSDEENISISIEFIEGLNMLKDQLQILSSSLNSKDFQDLWRSVVGGLDHFIFSSIILSNVKLSDRGVHQFRVDMRALFLVFRPFCIRPEAFFPYLSDSMKLLAMSWEEIRHLLGVLLRGEKEVQECLHLYGLFHLSLDQVEKILSNQKLDVDLMKLGITS